MKPSQSKPSFLAVHRPLIVASALLMGATVNAQSTGASGAATSGSPNQTDRSYQTQPDSTTSSATSTTSDSATPSGNPSARPGTKETTATGSGYHSGKASADADATTEINAQNGIGAGAPTGRDSKLGWGDRRFITKAADSGQAELSMAKLAAERASNAEVKNFAQKLVEAHSMVNAELTGIAGKRNVKLDSDDDQDRSFKRLSKKSGAEFDQEFVEHMIDEHEKDIKLFEKASQDAKDPEVRAFAAKHIDHLREHLRKAEGLRQTVMPTGRLDAASGRATSTSTDTSGAAGTDAGTTTGSATSTTEQGNRGSSSTGSTDTNRGVDSSTQGSSAGTTSGDTPKGSR